MKEILIDFKSIALTTRPSVLYNMEKKYIKKFFWFQNIFNFPILNFPKDSQKIVYVLTHLFLSYHQKRTLFENKERELKILKKIFKYLKREFFNYFFFIRYFISSKPKSDSIKIKKRFFSKWFSSINLNIEIKILRELEFKFEKIKKIVLKYEIPGFFLSKRKKCSTDFQNKSIIVNISFFCSLNNFKNTNKKIWFFFDNLHGLQKTQKNNFRNSIFSIEKDSSIFVEKIYKIIDNKKKKKIK